MQKGLMSSSDPIDGSSKVSLIGVANLFPVGSKLSVSIIDSRRICVYYSSTIQPPFVSKYSEVLTLG